jgi:hypothetical protein
MREPQATSILGALRRVLALSPLRLVPAAVIVSASLATIAHAQIRRGASVGPDYGWWISGGESAVVMNDITDGASQSKWRFGSDPLWQARGTIEKALDEFTTFGVVVGYGRVPVQLSSIATGDNPKLVTACQVSCAATTQLWTGMAQFRSGGGDGFHTFFEASGGTTVFRDFRTEARGADTAAVPITGIRRSIDLSGILGAGFGYTLSRSLVVTLVQDVGIGFHSKTDLPEGTGRTWRMRNTRLALRLKFGGR